ncbi:hypothetical protein jk1599 [Corynebacterium jeikeium K411]|uniref:Uncharacterized protein n=1 Tax=Corynebacterium jeikeium (strain K411) TaxID=306537 RepID=Q4JTT4_CORJK|nr:hypothetical protein jk1599 [Corynebacterium jeikeium K411]
MAQIWSNTPLLDSIGRFDDARITWESSRIVLLSFALLARNGLNNMMGGYSKTLHFAD